MKFASTLVILISAMQFFSLTACGGESSTEVSGDDDSGEAINDSLSGRTWFVIGDSFSMGDWSGESRVPTIQDGKYRGKLPVYSYLIGNRTGMDVRNIAVSGSTMTMYDGSTVANTFTHPQGLLYTTDFSGADYITIYYGINDSFLGLPVGSIDDTVMTTFYGAYNATLDYIKAHSPNAKIGLIVSNGCASVDFPNATVEIAKKWGLPYLDLDGGVGCPTMLLCSSRNPASEEKKMSVLLEQRISSINNHPNEFAHRLESTCIENWLRSL